MDSTYITSCVSLLVGVGLIFWDFACQNKLQQSRLRGGRILFVSSRKVPSTQWLSGR